MFRTLVWGKIRENLLKLGSTFEYNLLASRKVDKNIIE